MRIIIWVGLIGWLTGAGALHGESTMLEHSSRRFLGGVGGVYLLVESGELVVEIQKRDHHDDLAPMDLRAILVGPDRRFLDEAVIEGDGTARLTTTVEAKGVYVVNITVAFDRYGEYVWWGFRTNCPRYLIETSRGHRDARHMERIVLGPPLYEDDATESYDICFLPTETEFPIHISGLPDPEPPTLFGADEEKLVIFDEIDSDQSTHFDVPALEHPTDRPWRLHLPHGAAEVQIGGVTQWERGDRLDNLSLWSPDRHSFFPFHDLRWALTPYRHAFHAAPGESREIGLRLHNNGDDADTLHLSVEGSLAVTLSGPIVEVGSSEVISVVATATVPSDASLGDTLTARITLGSSHHPDFATWSTIEVRVSDRDPISEPLELPIVYRPYEHENAQFGYTPDYPNDNQIYFDADNRPVVCANDGVHRWNGDRWEWLDTVEGTHFRAGGSKVAFGSQGEICLLAASKEGPAYLYSPDGATFIAHTEPPPESRTQADIEQFAGHNAPAGPAPIVVATQTGGPDPDHFWRRVNDLDLYLPRFDQGRLDIGEPISISKQAIGISAHSGIPSSLASRGDRVHVIWGEATDPDEDVPGVPAYVATWDRSEDRWLGKPALVGYGPPANDIHNTPSLVIDSEGYLHTLTGTHGKPFAYARSLMPNTAHEGFTEPVLVEEGLRSTYIGLVCDPEDALHLVFRAWRSDGVYHPHNYYAILGYKRKLKDGEWEPTRVLAVPPFLDYSVWYHRLTIDRRGRLFLSFDIWSTYWFYRTDHVGDSRKTIMSGDGGDTWRLLRSGDL